MAVTETAANTYATKADNTIATTPNQVATITDSSGLLRQVMVLGAGDGTATVLGTTANPLVIGGDLNLSSILGAFIATVAPGVLLTGAAGSMGETVDTTQGALNVFTKNPAPIYPVNTSIAALATSQMLMAANSSRKQAAIFNDSTATLYLLHGANASTTAYTVQLSPNAYYEFPYPCYLGRVDGIWGAANGSARITESS